MTVDKNLRIGIVGTGAIAASFAALFTGNGYKTTVIGRSEISVNKARDAYTRIFDVLEERKLVTHEQRKSCAAFFSYSTDYEDLRDAELVFEAVYEDLNIKYEVYKKIELHCQKIEAIASATSVLAPDDLKKPFEKYRPQFLVAHPYNPAHLVPFVELVGSDETSAKAMQFAKEFLESCGRKVCLMKKSVPGFLANRLQHAMVREALYLVREGVATPADIDMALTWSFGPRYTKVGLLQHQDGYGLDMLEGLQNYLYPHLCNDSGASPVVSEAVRQGNLGQKTGKGLHDWNEEKIAEFRRGAAEPYWRFFNWNLP
ncbi:MAG: 3-hydroxyacyl-CoA dehydrogenase family protein [Treponema sp.]|nr:3-hydroxyacyl-CoA dehydrogenase family protein [Treponema sp.]